MSSSESVSTTFVAHHSLLNHPVATVNYINKTKYQFKTLHPLLLHLTVFYDHFTHRTRLLKGMLSHVQVAIGSAPLTIPVVLYQGVTNSTAAQVDTRVNWACAKNPELNFLQLSLLHLRPKL